MAEVIIYIPCFDRAAPRYIVNYGALAVATALKAEGASVLYLDGSSGSMEAILHRLDEELKDCLFFGVSAFTAQVEEGLLVTDYVKTVKPDLPVIWGGIHASLLPEETAADPSIDYVCAGEGDISIIEFYQQLASGKPDMHKVSNLMFYEGDELVKTGIAPFFEMDTYPRMAWELLDLERYVIHNRFDGDCPSLGIQIGRGCPHRCTFCINVALRDYGYTKYRYRSPEFVDEELAYLKDRLNIGFSFVRNEVFFINLEYSRKVAEVYKRHNILWGANIRASYFGEKGVTADYLSEMHELGMLNGSMGVESGSPRVLRDIVCKDVTHEQIELALLAMKQAKIRPFISFILGFPGETEAERRETLDCAHRLKKLVPNTVVPGVYLLRPYPGAPIYNACLEAGMKVPNTLREWSDHFITRQGGFTPDEMPWLSGSKRLYETAEYETAALNDPSPSAGIMENTYLRCAKLRSKAGFYGFPIELWARKRFQGLRHQIRKWQGRAS